MRKASFLTVLKILLVFTVKAQFNISSGLLNRNEPIGYPVFFKVLKELSSSNLKHKESPPVNSRFKVIGWDNSRLNNQQRIVLRETNTTSTQINCNNWLNLPSYQSYVSIGDLDVPGDQITVEATFMRTAAYTGGQLWAGDLVAKHNDPTDANYLLRPNNAEITTTNGYFRTPDICEIELNKIYHAALVYDGTTLKFYRNGYLMSSVNASGDLFQNNFNTRIGLYDALVHNTNLIGYINEVRIWNVARSQTQIRSFMNTPIANPATQPGLLAYYSFDNLINKQGNTSFNGALGGSATINAIIPSCNFSIDSCDQIQSCNNWLSLPSYPSSVSVGDVDVIGNQLTVEAVFNRRSSFNPAFHFGKIVSKHTGPGDVNYSLMATTCEITTTNGYINTPDVCLPEYDKTYHVAMVYNGIELKFYRNGFLISSVPWSGNLVNTDLLTTIGTGPNNPGSPYQDYSNINEVRIWNVARSQNQIRTFMNTSLPNPTTQNGLLAYYTFDNLVNKQGNAAFNGIVEGSAEINTINPNCNLAIDSCEENVSTSLIINEYTPVQNFNPCNNELIVEDASLFNLGDTVLLIQMKGAVIDSSNTATFGNITDYKNAGNYEFNYIKSINGNTIELKNTVLRNYDIPNGKVQLIRVPYYQNANITNTLTAEPWDGKKGGVLVFNIAQTLTLNADLDVSGKGFRGGKSINSQLLNWQSSCQSADYFYASTLTSAQDKGEGISSVSSSKMSGRGKLANGGGGGNLSNSGGGGGSNASVGGRGGDQYQDCSVTSFQNGGLPGAALVYSSASNKLFMGGGGGAGDANDPNGTNSFNADGGNGGGIIIIKAGQIINNGFSIIANGDNGKFCTQNCNEGAGGGGAGGTILISSNNLTNNINIIANGGNGANNTSVNDNGILYNHGPGGGGSGGVILFNQPAKPAFATVDLNKGMSGVAVNNGNTPWGAQTGTDGIVQYNYSLPISTIPFKPNIDSIRITSNSSSCNGFNFNGFAYTNTSPVITWQWHFGDGSTANTQNTAHTFSPDGLFNVKLIGTDANGCKDSFAIAVAAIPLPAAPIVSTVQPNCSVSTGTITITSPSGPGNEYSIDGTNYQSNSSFFNIQAGTYSVTVRTTANGCVSPANTITIDPVPPISSNPQLNITHPTCLQVTGSIEITSPTGAQLEYSLNNGVFQASNSFPLLAPGTYQIRVRNAATLCISSPASATINPIPLPPSSPVITNLVQPTCTITTGSFSITSPLGPNLLYSIDGTNFQSSANFSGVQPGNYNLITSNSITECISLPTPITIDPLPQPPPAPIITVTQQPSCTTASGSLLINSPIGSGFEFSRGNNIYQTSSLFNNLDTGLYSITVRDRLNGCISVPVTIQIKPDLSIPGSFFIPNAFSPNNDGLNDCFGIKNWGLISEFKLAVYNRWGNEIFYTTNPNECWNGTYKGVQQNPDNYVYYIKAVTLCGIVERKGNLALIR
jgi:gliding motility-associated-like protein